MILSDLSKKADFIAARHRLLQTHWHQYGNTLVQAITLSRPRLHLTVNCDPAQGLSFWLFDHFQIHINPAEAFNSHTLCYRLENRDGSEGVSLGDAHLGDDGLLDSAVNIHDRDAVLEHFLLKISPLYDRISRAVEHGEDLPLGSLA